MALADDDTPRLGCGLPVDDIWDTVDEPLTPHEQTCPDCQAARKSLEELTAATQAMRTDDDGDPGLRPRATLTRDIMTIARAEVRRGRQIPLNHPRTGREVADLMVSEQAVASVVRAVGDRTFDTVHARRCRVELDLTPIPANTDSNGPGDQPALVQIQLTISISAKQSIPESVTVLREQIIDHIADEIGLIVTRVDITVEDVHDF
ncbi:MAG: hypothetical protein H0T91_00515 [Propionibacteriaceae bacterium]|nr:hypothetical protein [Propionibacteriaceae bacterium]